VGKNKNNFCNSIRKNFPELIPNYAKNTDIQNFLAFNPDDLVRFGKLEKVFLNKRIVDKK